LRQDDEEEIILAPTKHTSPKDCFSSKNQSVI